tara:strand:+ start:3057 stop:3839 length:783 start_codon:yes stop_codon:yes gene_type:complete
MVLDHGFVRLVDHMPQCDLDSSIVQAARVSYAGGTKSTRNERGLIRYLLRHWHTTPFEMVEFKFHIKMPIFVARQHLRHRTASVNELSARYSVVPDEYYEPETYRQQSQVNKQSSEGDLELDQDLKNLLVSNKEQAFEVYNQALEAGCSRELARCHLPQSTYTEFYWKINLHNLMHYLHLRMEAGAQQEIRDYANAIYDLVKPLVPVTMEAFMDFRVNAIQFTGPEVQAMNKGTKLSSPGEQREFEAKLVKIGMFPNFTC